MTLAARFFIRVFYSLVLTFLCASSALAQQDYDRVQITTEKVTDGIYMLVGRGGNIGISAGEDCVFMIDDQFAPLTEKILAAVAAISDKSVRFLINTHLHGDHTGGNENLGKTGTVIVAHENVRRWMNAEQIPGFVNDSEPKPKDALPVITFTTDITFHLNGNEIRVFHVDPAHTDGDAIIYFKDSNVIHAGDIYFANGFPYIDLGHGGSSAGLLAAIEIMLGTGNEQSKIIPGHGPLSTKSDLRVYQAMIISVRDRVKALVAQKKTLEEVLAAKPSQEYDKQWGGGFMKTERFISILYEDLGGGK